MSTPAKSRDFAENKSLDNLITQAHRELVLERQRLVTKTTFWTNLYMEDIKAGTEVNLYEEVVVKASQNELNNTGTNRHDLNFNTERTENNVYMDMKFRKETFNTDYIDMNTL